jgi:hypothetical protein
MSRQITQYIFTNINVIYVIAICYVASMSIFHVGIGCPIILPLGSKQAPSGHLLRGRA